MSKKKSIVGKRMMLACEVRVNDMILLPAYSIVFVDDISDPEQAVAYHPETDAHFEIFPEELTSFN